MKLSTAPKNTSKRVLLFGPPKSGKSLLAGKLANKYNLIWFDLENGHATLFQLPPEAQDRIELINIPDTRSWPIAISTMLKVIKGGPTKICEEHGKVDCAVCIKAGAPFTQVELNNLDRETIVVVDSLTQLSNSALAHITINQAEDYKVQTDDWGNLGKLLDSFLSQVQQAKFHVVCITHETETEMEDGKSKVVPTAGTRNFSRNTAKYFDEVYYVEVKLGKHMVGSKTTYNPKILTGSRANILMESAGEPSLIPIFDGSVNIGAPASNTGAAPIVAAASKLSGLQALMANKK
jgi:adenosyl cobinamide kinase/adenosyl cobinamide phosphate guanylyltransferase